MIFDGFGVDLGRVRGVFWATWGDFGESSACSGGVCARCFRQGGPQRVPESDLAGFGVDFGWILGGILEAFGIIFDGFCGTFQASESKAQAKQKQRESKSKATRQQSEAQSEEQSESKATAKQQQSESKTRTKRKRSDSKAKAKREQSESNARATREQRESRARAQREQSESQTLNKSKTRAKRTQSESKTKAKPEEHKSKSKAKREQSKSKATAKRRQSEAAREVRIWKQGDATRSQDVTKWGEIETDRPREVSWERTSRTLFPFPC